MLIHATEPLFAWGQLEDCPTLGTIRDFLAAVPDHDLIAGLVAARGHGRDDYPVARLWRIVLLTIGVDPTVMARAATWRPSKRLLTFRRSAASVEFVETPQTSTVGPATLYKKRLL
jgi:hypothetical protein